MIGSRYELEDKLGMGGMGTVYRAYDRLKNHYVALKRIPLSSVTSDVSVRLALAREFKTLAALRHPNIINVLDYGFDAERQPFFTMELLEDARIITTAASQQPKAEQVRLLLQLLQALAYLHRRGVIHRDLKPGNVLVTREGQVKVLDFGIAQDMSDSRIRHAPAGTLIYIAPEILLDQPASVQSDLYAFGVIAYEIFTEHLPFEGDLGSVIADILARSPDLSQLPDSVTELMGKLLSKEAQDRCASAEVVIEALCQATAAPKPAESWALRETLLTGAQFVGRKDELDTLRDALQAAFEGQGSAWLVGGESGVGKSRLMEELRIQAQVDGALTLYGQAIPEGSVPFRLWHDTLRYLLLQATTVQEGEWAVLGAILPHNERKHSGSLDRQALAQALLALLRSQSSPVLLILEDLHWATDSLELLKPLLKEVHNHPWLIVGSYRDDERPTLHQELPLMRHLKLERLSPQDIHDLTQAMLGRVQRHQEIVELLQRETKGNAFFIVEVVRAIVESSGGLNEVGRATLPRTVFEGGVQQVIQRRLQRVEEEALELLKWSAIVGKAIDLGLLALLRPQARLEAWLDSCTSAAILELVGDRWRFSHDRIRDVLLRSLDDDERARRHGQIAQALEELYGASEEWAGVLAYHWQRAGDAARSQLHQQRALAYAAQADAPLTLGELRKS